MGTLVQGGKPVKTYEIEVARVHQFKRGSGLRVTWQHLFPSVVRLDSFPHGGARKLCHPLSSLTPAIFRPPISKSAHDFSDLKPSDWKNPSFSLSSTDSTAQQPLGACNSPQSIAAWISSDQQVKNRWWAKPSTWQVPSSSSLAVDSPTQRLSSVRAANHWP